MQLKRSLKDRMIAGVCGGLSKELGIDPAILRMVFVASVLLWGVGAIPYLVLWIVLPEGD